MKRIVKNYFDDDTMRESLNDLTRETFGFDFRNWYDSGYYTGEYIPYSIEMDGKIISNASANIMKFVKVEENEETTERTYIQIGTVMTAVKHRRKGYAGKLIKEIIKDYKDQCDGIYLFGNLSALDFYSELGFWKSNQYKVSIKKDAIIEKVNPDFMVIEDDVKKQELYLNKVKSAVPNSSFDQSNRFGLQMFYTGEFENVYYSESLNCFVSYEMDEKTLYLNSIIADKVISVRNILTRISEKFDRIEVGFTPRIGEDGSFDFEKYDGGDDYRLFCLGDTLKEIEECKLYFPEYSHA